MCKICKLCKSLFEGKAYTQDFFANSSDLIIKIHPFSGSKNNYSPQNATGSLSIMSIFHSRVGGAKLALMEPRGAGFQYKREKIRNVKVWSDRGDFYCTPHREAELLKLSMPQMSESGEGYTYVLCICLCICNMKASMLVLSSQKFCCKPIYQGCQTSKSVTWHKASQAPLLPHHVHRTCFKSEMKSNFRGLPLIIFHNTSYRTPGCWTLSWFSRIKKKNSEHRDA